MKKRMNKAIALMLALVLVLASAPLSAAAKQEDFDIQSKGIVENVPARLPADLSDGEIFTYSSVTSEPLPSTDFIVNLSALGQQYVTTTTTVQRFNIVMLLDVSNSMEGSRMTNMVNAANGAIDTLYGNGNKISIITFATETQVDRALSEKDLQLKQSGSSNTGGAVDSIRISLRSNSSYGGTNIQAGLIAAYNVLNNANDDEAIPVIILLSDGAPTYYYSDIDGMRTGSTGRSGNGTTSDTNYAACTIAQAAYLKAIMDDLEIYTIPFSLSTSDSMYDEAAATMNPSDANIAKLNGFNQRWNQALGTVSASNAALMQRYYPNGAYSASNSSASLSEALTKIITDMNFNTPIDETKVNNVLDDASFLWMKYQIGTGYYLKNNTLTVTLNGNSYPLEKIGNEFIYNTPVSDPNYNEKLLRLSVTVSDTGLMTWKIPAKVLPCNTPEGESQVLATPIALTFRVSFNMDMEGLSAGNYPTGDSCLIYFTPTDTNPFYYHQAEKTGPDKLAENDTVLENETRVYSAMYPYPGNDNYARYGNPNPELTGFATGSALDSLSYVSGPQSITVTAYSDYSGAYRDAMTVSYQEQEINFSDIGFKTASASFTTTDKTDISKYRLLSFSDGNGWNTTDNTALSIGLPINSNGTVDITITYDEGKRSVLFSNVIFKEERYVPGQVSVVFRGYYGSSLNIKDLYVYQINGATVNYLVNKKDYSLDYYSNPYDYFNINLTIDGTDYYFPSVPLNYRESNSYSAPQTGMVPGNSFTASNKTQNYYYTSASMTREVSREIENFKLIYNEEQGKLTVQIKNGAVWSTEAVYTADPDTLVEKDKPGQGNYSITRFSGNEKTIITYSVVDGVLFKSSLKVRAVDMPNDEDEADIRTGLVTHTSFNYGMITLTNTAFTPEELAQECGAVVTMKSTYNTAFTTATSQNIAYVYVYFTVSQPVTDIQIALSPDAPGFGLAPKITEIKRMNSSGNYVDSALEPAVPGTYRIKYELTFKKIDPMPEFAFVRFAGATFKFEGDDANLLPNANHAEQNVKVRFDTASGH